MDLVEGHVNLDSNKWVLALMVVKFDEKHGQQVQSIYPPQIFPPAIINDIKMLAMPDCMEPGAKHEFQFMVRIRNKNYEENTNLPMFLNCFASFRQCPDPTTKRGYFQQSVVLVSRLSFVSLFYNILTRLSGVLADIPGFEEMLMANQTSTSELESDSGYVVLDSGTRGEKPTPTRSKVAIDPTSGILDATLEVGFQHFLQWPIPEEGRTYRLPFYGNMIPFRVPIISPYYSLNQHSDLHNKSLSEILSSGGMDNSSGLFHSINLMAVLNRVGLLPHIWTLWEVLVTGQDVVVWSPCAAVCSAVVTALVSLISPMAYSGDFRPYVNPYDSDVTLLANATRAKYQHFTRQYGDCMKLTALQLAFLDEPSTAADSRSDAHDSEDEEDDHSEDVGTANSWIWTENYLTEMTHLVNQSSTARPDTSGSNGFELNPEVGNIPESPTAKSLQGFQHIFHPEKPRQPEIHTRSISNNPDGNRLVGMIIGITNPFLLKSFAHAHCAILLPNPELDRTKPDKRPSTSGGDAGSAMSSFTSYFRSFSMDTSSMVSTARASTVSTASSSSSLFSMFSGNNVSIPQSPAPRGEPSPTTPSEEQPSRMNLFSPMRIDISSTRHLKSRSTKSEDHAEPAYTTTLKVLSIHDSIEEWYDQWIEAGGMHRKTFHGILCVRNQPSVLPDKEIMRQCSSLSTAVNNDSSQPTVERGDADEDLWGEFSGQVDIGFESERTVVGTMILRQHFRLLTSALLRPFESFFKPVALNINSSGSGFNSSFTVPTLNSAVSLHVGSFNTAGATSMLLYSNPLNILGKSNVFQSVEEFASKESSEASLPRPIRKSDWKSLLLAFGKSCTFRAWCRWRRELECLQLILMSSQACVNLSARELLAAFAVEQGVDQLTPTHLQQLLIRIAFTVRALFIIEERYFVIKKDSDCGDISRQASRKSCVDEIDFVGKAAGGEKFKVGSRAVRARPGDLIYFMKRHFAAILKIMHGQVDRLNSRPSSSIASTQISEMIGEPLDSHQEESDSDVADCILESRGGDISLGGSWGLRSSQLTDSDDESDIAVEN